MTLQYKQIPSMPCKEAATRLIAHGSLLLQCRQEESTPAAVQSTQSLPQPPGPPHGFCLPVVGRWAPWCGVHFRDKLPQLCLNHYSLICEAASGCRTTLPPACFPPVSAEVAGNWRWSPWSGLPWWREESSMTTSMTTASIVLSRCTCHFHPQR